MVTRINTLIGPFKLPYLFHLVRLLNEQWFKTTKCTVPSVSGHMSQQCAGLCHTMPQLWQVSKSQQVYRSIPWDSFNGDTWSGLWIREEMKDHPLSQQLSTKVTVTHMEGLISLRAFKRNILNADDLRNYFWKAECGISALFIFHFLPQCHKTVPAGRGINFAISPRSFWWQYP